MLTRILRFNGKRIKLSFFTLRSVKKFILSLPNSVIQYKKDAARRKTGVRRAPGSGQPELGSGFRPVRSQESEVNNYQLSIFAFCLRDFPVAVLDRTTILVKDNYNRFPN